MSTEDSLHYSSCIKETVAFNATQIQTNTLLQMAAFRASLHGDNKFWSEETIE